MSVISNNQLAGAAGQGGAADFQIDRSLRFNDDDDANLAFTPSSSSNMKTYTWSFWVKRCFLGNDYHAIYSTNGEQGIYFQFDSADNLDFGDYYGGGYQFRLITARKFRDVSAWYHIVIAVDTTQATASDRVKMYVNGVQETSLLTSNYPSQNFEGSVNRTSIVNKIGEMTTAGNLDGYLAEFHSIDGTQLAATDFGKFDDNNVWQPKKYSGTYGTNGFYLKFADNSSNAALGTDSSGNSNTWTVNNISGPGGPADYTTGLSIPEGGGFHASNPAVNAFDGNTSTAALGANTSTSVRWTVNSSWSLSGAVEIYVSGAAMTVTFDDSRTAVTAAANAWTQVSSSVDFTWINIYQGSGLRGNLAAVRVGGTVLINTTGANNDSLIDTPTNYEAASGNPGGNYCGMNPLDMKSNVATHNGNMEVKNATAGWSGIRGTMGVDSGKWYYELKTESSEMFAGIATSAVDIYANAPQDTTSVMDGGSLVYCDDGKYLLDQGGSSNRVSYGSALANGDILGVAFDLDGNTVQFYKNGSALGSINISSSPLASNIVFPYLISYNNSTTTYFNFGQRPFTYTPPSGYKALCTTNLPDPAIADGSTAMDVTLYTGSSATQTQSGLNHAPSLVWTKSRSDASNHALYDIVRGVSKRLQANSSDAEDTRSGVTSFNSDGWTEGTFDNYSPYTYVGWAWDAGSSNTSISAGGLNSSAYSFDNWTSMVTGNYSSAHGWGTTYQTLNAFDGNLSTMVIAHGTDGWKFEPTNAIAGDTIEIYGWNDGCPNAGLKINGNNYGDALGADQTVGQWYTLPYSTLSSIEMAGDGSAGSSEFRLIAIRIDGKILIQNNQSPPNVPSIASTVRANPSAGFSIVSYTGTGASASVGHGLNSAPGFIIIKRRNGTVDWVNYHSALGVDKYVQLNLTSAATTSSGYWGTVNSNTFGLPSFSTPNASGGTYVAYCFAPVAGYSAFGSYTGNGSSTDGPFVFTGFKVKYLLLKLSSDSGQRWYIQDVDRDFNPNDAALYADSSDSEYSSSSYAIDFLSNGFKVRNTNGSHNTSGATYIYAAFAEHPFKTARAR